MASGTSFWKIFFGVLAALVVAGSCVVGGCLLVLGKGAMSVAEHQKEKQAYLNSLTVKVTSLTRDDHYTHVKGSVTNDGAKVVTYWKVRAEFKDKSGTVIDTAFTNALERLGPRQSKTFDLMHQDDPRFTTVDCILEEVSIE